MLTIAEQFKGKEGRQALVESLRGMILLRASESLAEDVADQVEIISTPAGSVLIEEGGTDSDMYFLLSGRLQVLVRNREYALLAPGAHVGEFSLLDPGSRRSATVCALEDSVTAKLSQEAFAGVAERHPAIWHSVSRILGSHLREGNRFLRVPNARPQLLVCASPVGSFFAEAIQARARDTEHHIPDWIVDSRCPAEGESLERLEKALGDADLGAIVVAPGELDALPHEEVGPGHDAILLYCGLAVGALGRNRTILVRPEPLDSASPAEMLGVTELTYRLDPYEATRSDLENICRRLQEMVRKLGAR